MHVRAEYEASVPCPCARESICRIRHLDVGAGNRRSHNDILRRRSRIAETTRLPGTGEALRGGGIRTAICGGLSSIPGKRGLCPDVAGTVRSCELGALANPASFSLTGAGDPERIEGATCTRPLFQVLGVVPQLGRTFVESDDQPGTNRYLVISDSLWHRRLGADLGVIGKTLRIDGRASRCGRRAAPGFSVSIR